MALLSRLQSEKWQATQTRKTH